MITPTLLAFEAKLKTIPASVEQEPAHWWADILWQRQHGRCIFCDGPVILMGGTSDRGVVHQVIPGAHGGAALEANLVMACLGCVHERGDADWITWGKAVNPASIARQRLRALQFCSVMHYTRSAQGYRTEPAVKRHLGKRWVHPRSTVYAFCSADGGYFGIREASAPPALAAILALHGGVQVSPWVWRVDPDRFIKAVWGLIESNAWVKRVRLEGIDSVDLARSFEEGQWWCVVRSTKEVAARRGRVLPPMLPLKLKAQEGKRLRDARRG